jgi:DNA-binding transcriptional LysR family regulator
VADERSFTRAAARLGMSQSALSHTVRRLETRLGLRLLARTTRSVAPTDAGEQLAATLRPAFSDIETRLDQLGELRDRPSGTLRLTSGEHAARTVLWPALERLLPAYPDIRVEVATD